MSKHTPGPWRAMGVMVEHPNGSVADICSCNLADFGQHNYMRSYEEMCADARLIAAAPELLEALRALDMLFSPVVSDSTQAYWIDKARAAIAKATGETT